MSDSTSLKRTQQGVAAASAPTLAFKAVAVWLLILTCAVINGALRESFLLPGLGTVAAFATSGLLLCLCVVAVSTALVPWFGQLHRASYLLLGVFWVFLTLAFEFGFGHFVQGKAWPRLFEAYTFTEDNLWPVVLVVIVFAPSLAAHLRGLPTSMAMIRGSTVRLHEHGVPPAH